MAGPKIWYGIKISITPETEEAITNFLFEIGGVGCSVMDDVLMAYFAEKDWDDHQYQRLSNYLQELSDLGFDIDRQKIEVTEIPEKDWHAAWKKSLTPIFVSPNIIIKPTFIELPPSEKALVIEIDPQMAFGSGAHATTQLMLRLMQTHVQSCQSVLDIGTGSGILAIAAVKLWDSEVIACDIDPIAAVTARENAHANNTAQRSTIFTGTIDCLVRKRFDLILANITRSEIVKLIPLMVDRLTPGGTIILSGILVEEEDKLLRFLNNFHFRSFTNLQQDEWLGIVIK